MASDSQGGGKNPKWASRETTPGVRFDSGPFIGIIKNNVDPTRQGRLDVWIPAFGGDENVKANWYNVGYASPFFGISQGSPGNTDPDSAQQAYGFWAVPPDINNHVLVTFVMGDPSQGYWFACVFDNTQINQTLPGNSRPEDPKKLDVQPSYASRGIDNSGQFYLPASESNLEEKGKDTEPGYLDFPRRILPHQADIVLRQGLETDPLRGTIRSSSQRESPSNVVGLSSPGRPNRDPATDYPGGAVFLDGELKKGKEGFSIRDYQDIPFRKGGHSLVMDDGDLKGNSRLLRLRSAGGHQILMNDTANVMYIINSIGSAWVELIPDGSINIFSNNNVNIRTVTDINLHADGNIKMHAGDTIQMYAEKQILTETQVERKTAVTNFSLNAGKVGVKSDSSLLMQSVSGGWGCSGKLVLKGSKIFLNTMAPADPEENDKFTFINHDNTELDPSINRWIKKPAAFSSIVPYAPTHEPWTRQPGVPKDG